MFAYLNLIYGERRYSPNFGRAESWIWRLVFQHNTDSSGNRVYSAFLAVVMTDDELQDPSWSRDVRIMELMIVNSEGRQLKSKSMAAYFSEQQQSWGYMGFTDHIT